jgi:hypothetical protein
MVEYVPPNLPDGGSHCWLASSTHPRIVLCFTHLLLRTIRNTFSFSLLPGGARSTAVAAGQRAIVSAVRSNPAAALLAAPPGKVSQSGFEERRRCVTACLPTAAPICRLHRLVCLPCSGVGVPGVSIRGVARPQATLALAWGVEKIFRLDCSTLYCTVAHCSILCTEDGLGRALILATQLVSIDGTQAPELSLVVSPIPGESNARIAIYSNNTPDSYACSDS